MFCISWCCPYKQLLSHSQSCYLLLDHHPDWMLHDDRYVENQPFWQCCQNVCTIKMNTYWRPHNFNLKPTFPLQSEVYLPGALVAGGLPGGWISAVWNSFRGEFWYSTEFPPCSHPTAITTHPDSGVCVSRSEVPTMHRVVKAVLHFTRIKTVKHSLSPSQETEATRGDFAFWLPLMNKYDYMFWTMISVTDFIGQSVQSCSWSVCFYISVYKLSCTPQQPTGGFVFRLCCDLVKSWCANLNKVSDGSTVI